MEVEALDKLYDVTVAGHAFSSVGSLASTRFVQLPEMPTGRRSTAFRIRRRIRASSSKMAAGIRGVWDADSQVELKSRRPETATWLDVLRRIPADLLIVHHARNLPLAHKLAGEKRIPLVFNAHEYYPREFEGNKWWEENVRDVAEFVCRRFLPEAKAIFAVSESIAAEYGNQFGVHADVLMSTKPFHDLAPSPVDPQCIRVIHHGVANPDREIERMIELIDLLDERFRIDFMLVPSSSHPGYFAGLKQRIEQHPRLRLLSPVTTREIASATNDYDIGLFLLMPTTFNLRHALPNKFFEFVQARLCVAFSQINEVVRLVEQFDFGIVSEESTPESMAAALNALTTEQIEAFKQAAHDAARELSSDRGYVQIRTTVEELLGGAV